MRAMLVLFALLLSATAASAQQPPCGPRDNIIGLLTSAKYGELPMLELGSLDGSSVMHLYSNMTTGTWSLVVFPQPGIACLIATGKSIEPMGEAPKPEDSL